MKKRILLVLMAAIIAFGSAGCGKKEETVSGEKPTIKFMMSFSENGGQATQIIEAMFEMAGIDGELIQAPSASYSEKLNATLASGNLPDIVNMDETTMNGWIDEGALLAMDDVLDEYAPNFKGVLQEDDMKNLVHPGDGKLYGLPYILRLPAQRTMGVRRDWLNKLGLEAPETIEELEAVLTAFKENADKLGTDLVIPYAGLLSPFYMMYGISESGEQGMWTLDADGNYISRFEHPNYRECLEMLNRFYTNGLIDPEYFSRNTDENSVYSLFNNNNAGLGYPYSTRLREVTELLQKTNENAVFDYMEPITGVDGQKRILGRALFGSRNCITIAAEDKIEECMKFLDWAYSKEGETLWNYGLEGVHYDMVDGAPVIREQFNHGWVDIRKEGIVPTNMAYNRSLDAYNQCMFYGKELEELTELEKLTYKAYYENEKYVITPLRAFRTETSLAKGTDIYAALKEKETKAIVGSITIDEFFDSLKTIKKNGLDKITEEMGEYWKKLNK
ncbi:MAG: extracellular solute-binding protein [Clostridia bacterium]|nr:extracellular solute-binding protein [Clostridia bacterium]